jgi:integrase
VNPDRLSYAFRTLAPKIGLPRIRFHDLRHSCATAALAAGVPIKVLWQRLGHADVAVTLKMYAHVLPGDEAAAERAALILV